MKMIPSIYDMYSNTTIKTIFRNITVFTKEVALD